MHRWTAGTRARAERVARVDCAVVKPQRRVPSPIPPWLVQPHRLPSAPDVVHDAHDPQSDITQCAPPSTSSITKAEQLLRAMLGPSRGTRARCGHTPSSSCVRRRSRREENTGHSRVRRAAAHGGGRSTCARRDKPSSPLSAATTSSTSSGDSFRFTYSQEERQRLGNDGTHSSASVSPVCTDPLSRSQDGDRTRSTRGAAATVRATSPSSASALSSSTIDCLSLRCALMAPAAAKAHHDARGDAIGDPNPPTKLFQPSIAYAGSACPGSQRLQAPLRADDGDPHDTTTTAFADVTATDAAVADLFADDSLTPQARPFPWEADAATVPRSAWGPSVAQAPADSAQWPEGAERQRCRVGVVGAWRSPPPQAPPGYAQPIGGGYAWRDRRGRTPSLVRQDVFLPQPYEEPFSCRLATDLPAGPRTPPLGVFANELVPNTARVSPRRLRSDCLGAWLPWDVPRDDADARYGTLEMPRWRQQPFASFRNDVNDVSPQRTDPWLPVPSSGLSSARVPAPSSVPGGTATGRHRRPLFASLRATGGGRNTRRYREFQAACYQRGLAQRGGHGA